MTLLLVQSRRSALSQQRIAFQQDTQNAPLPSRCEDPIPALHPPPPKNQSLFSSPHLRTHVSRNPHELLLQSMCSSGHLHTALDTLSDIHTPLSTPTYLALLKACIRGKSLSLIKHTRSHLAHYKVPITGFLGDYLVMALAKCGAVDDAHQLSSTLPHLTVFSWTAIILAYAECDRGEEALATY